MSAAVMPGAEPFTFEGGPVGFLMLHGFTGNPASQRPIGERLAARGHTVSSPLYPGHGTHWRDLDGVRWQEWEAEADRALAELASRCRTVIAFGLSAGGAMALHSAARHPETVRGVVAVNPYVLDRRIAPAFLIWPVLRTWKGVGNDIKKPAQHELAYERIPMRAVAELARFTKAVRAELARVRQPLLVFRSAEDHVVPTGAAEFILERVGSQQRELVELPNSYHVATLDYDADLILERTLEFADAVSRAAGRTETR